MHTRYSAARRPNPEIHEEELHGFKQFRLLLPIMESPHRNGCDRDKAANRKLHYGQYTALILVYFFFPIVTSLRGIQQVRQGQKIQRVLRLPVRR